MMTKRWIALGLLLVLLFSLALTATSCAKEDEAAVLEEAKRLLSASFTVNDMYLGEGIAYNEAGKKVGAYYEADAASLEAYGVATLSDIQAAARAVYSLAVCAQLQSTVLTAIQVDGMLVSPKRYYDLADKDKTLLMVATGYEPLGVGTTTFEDCRLLWVRGDEAEISVTLLSHYGEHPMQKKENVTLLLVKEENGWRLDDLSVLFYDTTLIEE